MLFRSLLDVGHLSRLGEDDLSVDTAEPEELVVHIFLAVINQGLSVVPKRVPLELQVLKLEVGHKVVDERVQELVVLGTLWTGSIGNARGREPSVAGG